MSVLKFSVFKIQRDDEQQKILQSGLWMPRF